MDHNVQTLDLDGICNVFFLTVNKRCTNLAEDKVSSMSGLEVPVCWQCAAWVLENRQRRA